MADAWERLEPKLRELKDLSAAIGLLHWDQAVMMPPAGAQARARTQATLEALAHDRVTDPEIGDLLGELESDDSLDGDRRASIRILRRDYDKATRIPKDLVRALAEAQGRSYAAWVEARPANDFSILEPHLSKLIDLKR